VLDEAEQRFSSRPGLELVTVKREPVERRQERSAHSVEVSRAAHVLDDRCSDLCQRLGSLCVDLKN
jgi:hypothetical protein